VSFFIYIFFFFFFLIFFFFFFFFSRASGHVCSCVCAQGCPEHVLPLHTELFFLYFVFAYSFGGDAKDILDGKSILMSPRPTALATRFTELAFGSTVAITRSPFIASSNNHPLVAVSEPNFDSNGIVLIAEMETVHGFPSVTTGRARPMQSIKFIGNNGTVSVSAAAFGRSMAFVLLGNR
jgi:hypothetical protein